MSDERDEEAGGWLGSWCAQCGPDVAVDEDGGCMTCGLDAVGDGADEAIRMRDSARKAEARVAELENAAGEYVGSTWARVAALDVPQSDVLRKALRGFEAALNSTPRYAPALTQSKHTTMERRSNGAYVKVEDLVKAAEALRVLPSEGVGRETVMGCAPRTRLRVDGGEHE